MKIKPHSTFLKDEYRYIKVKCEKPSLANVTLDLKQFDSSGVESKSPFFTLKAVEFDK